MMEGRVTNRGASMQQLTDARADKLRHVLVRRGQVSLHLGREGYARERWVTTPAPCSLQTQLGPAFVKIGQAISSRCAASLLGAWLVVHCLVSLRLTAGPCCRRAWVARRPDVAPPEFLRELEKLQDQIPPFCNEQAFGVIKAELGAPASQVFSSISPEAVAGGAGCVGHMPGCTSSSRQQHGVLEAAAGVLAQSMLSAAERQGQQLPRQRPSSALSTLLLPRCSRLAGAGVSRGTAGHRGGCGGEGAAPGGGPQHCAGRLHPAPGGR
jgi:hypothetical protein